jgi:predicted SnoaL-like aldol condensation-catalyzing enzyme
VIAEGDLVAVHSNYETWNTARVDIFLNDAGKIIEHWDLLQQVPETTASGNAMFPSWRKPNRHRAGRFRAAL